jgi:hypothetical protein
MTSVDQRKCQPGIEQFSIMKMTSTEELALKSGPRTSQKLVGSSSASEFGGPIITFPIVNYDFTTTAPAMGGANMPQLDIKTVSEESGEVAHS